MPQGQPAPVEPCDSAASHYRAGRFAKAAAVLAPLAAAVPPNATAVRLLGLCRLRLGDPRQALILLQQALNLAPHDPWAQLHLGLGLAAVGRHTEAIGLFRACLRLLPKDPTPAINLATSLLAIGDRPGAERAARKAVLRAPGQAASHYTLGLVRLAGGHLAPARDEFAAATRLAPGFADGWVNLGVALYRLGDIEAAKSAMRAGVAADPGHRAATGNLGALMRLTGETDAAEQLLTDLIARDGGAAEARVNLAAQLLLDDRTPEALALLDAPLPAEPRLRQHWQLQQALGFLQQDRPTEARAVLDGIGEVAPATLPLLLWRRLRLAVAEGRPEEAVRLAGEIETALADAGDIVPEHRIMAYFDLAQFWSRMTDAASTFRCWRKGHELLARFQPFSRPDYAAFVDATIARFNGARLHEGPRAGNADAAPVFVVGMPRSGTTLLEQILAAHPAVFAAGERVALSEAFNALGGGWETAAAVERIAGLDATAFDAQASKYLAELHALAPSARCIVDKMPSNFRYLGLTALLLPGARIIHCDRDPRDIGLSIFTFRFYGMHPYAHDLSDLGWYIGQHHRLIAHWHATLPNPMLTVRLRDWVEDFDGTLRRVLAFLDLPYDAACERFYEVERTVRTVSRRQVREKINARGLGRWRGFAEQLQPLIVALKETGVLAEGQD